MVFDERPGLEAPRPYVCRQGTLCPHAVQVALAPDRSRVSCSSEGAIASMDMIITRDAANWALIGLGKGYGGGGGSPSLVGKERMGESEGRRVQSVFWSIDVTLS